tara:strand:- start:211 stop:831 length:621 start_codon:yes stop_codon:yes gene_type:complete
MTAKFQVTPQTVRKDISKIGKELERYLENEEAVQLEANGCYERLKKRAQRDDSVGNRADELILNLLGNRSAKQLDFQLKQRELRLKDATAKLTEIKVELAQKALDASNVSSNTNGWKASVSNQIRRINENGAVGVQDIVEILTGYLHGSVNAGEGDNREMLTVVRMLFKIAIADPNANSPDMALVRLPDGMRIPAPEPDDGDDLLE